MVKASQFWQNSWTKNCVMDTDDRVAHPIPFVYWFGLQNLRRHMCCSPIKTKHIGVASITYPVSIVGWGKEKYQKKFFVEKRLKLVDEAWNNLHHAACTATFFFKKNNFLFFKSAQQLETWSKPVVLKCTKARGGESDS